MDELHATRRPGVFIAQASAEVFDEELAANETLIIGSEDLPRGWVVASDPELVKFGRQWWMFFNSIQLDFDRGLPIHVLSASLPPGELLSARPGKWTVHPNPVISPGPKGSWDAHTIETTKYVFGYDAAAKQFVGRLSSSAGQNRRMVRETIKSVFLSGMRSGVNGSNMANQW